jgi:hypothetical protein
MEFKGIAQKVHISFHNGHSHEQSILGFFGICVHFTCHEL